MMVADAINVMPFLGRLERKVRSIEHEHEKSSRRATTLRLYKKAQLVHSLVVSGSRYDL